MQKLNYVFEYVFEARALSTCRTVIFILRRSKVNAVTAMFLNAVFQQTNANMRIAICHSKINPIKNEHLLLKKILCKLNFVPQLESTLGDHRETLQRKTTIIQKNIHLHSVMNSILHHYTLNASMNVLLKIILVKKALIKMSTNT